jgi:IS5 family transposase
VNIDYQRTFASQAEFQKCGRKSRQQLFLDEMERIAPWSGLLALARPYYAKAGNGRRPVGLEIMLRVYFVQQRFDLSAPGVEEALYEAPVLQRFVGADLGAASAPDETAICHFRHLLDKRDLCGTMLEAMNVHLEAKGINIAIVDATIAGQIFRSKGEHHESTENRLAGRIRFLAAYPGHRVL